MSLNTRMNGARNKMVRGILLIFVLGFLFQCGKSDDDPPANLKLSTPEITFSDVSGAVGATYTISASRPPSERKTVKVTLTSTNDFLEVSPTEVTFAPTSASPQTITVKREGDADDMIMTEITGTITHDIAMGASHDADFTEFAMMNDTVNVTVTPYMPDSDSDGLIEIWTATMLDNMRYDLAGTSYKISRMDAGDNEGCPTGGCNGYELMANIYLLPLLDTNGNGEINMVKKTVAGKDHMVIDVSEDTSWVPVGDDTGGFTGTFEGNGYTIASLWVNISSSGNAYAGLFGRAGTPAQIRNVGVISGGVSSDASSFSYSGGLVGFSPSLTITNSYFSGSGGVSSSSSSSSSGGLVGSSSSLTITNSYFSGSGGVSSSSSSSSFSGGLVGSSDATLTITNSYFSGSGGVSSSSSSSSSSSGGLVGSSSVSLTITNSYFSGSGGVSASSGSSFSFSGGLVGFSSSLTITNSYFSGSGGVSSSSSKSYSGGLVGSSDATFTITNSYWNADAPQSTDGSPQNPKRVQGDATADPMGAVGLTLTQLQATSGAFPDLGDAWDLGTDQQNPAVKRCILNATMIGCASPAMYGDLLNGQR